MERIITVCDYCLQASCWQGEFLCDYAKSAGTRRMSESRLRELSRESPDYWLTDEEAAAGIRPGQQQRVK